MSFDQPGARSSAFADHGFRTTVDLLLEEVRTMYEADTIPWVVGYSGGKDSTATLQLVWQMLSSLPPDRRKKKVFVISTDTLVENPIVAAWVGSSLDSMTRAATEQELPLTAHRLTPAVADTFWVNLIGRGYPAPRPRFRWCTERLKIKPSNTFIGDVVRENGEAIIVLGTRKAESQARAKVMERLERQRIRERLSPNTTLPNSFVYSPIESWTNDDVWLFLMQIDNPWGFDNRQLLTMYQGASPDGECPLVVDTTTPSCGDSRFGCWTCTLVEKDKSMSAMIQNDEEKEWMLPLLEIRNRLDVADDRHLRDFRRMSGHVQLFNDKPVPGPYRQKVREQWLREVLSAQRFIQESGPEYVRNLELISLPELEEIRRIWVVDKHEIEDSLPGIYEEVMGKPYPGHKLDDHLALGSYEIGLLRDLCGADELQFQTIRELLDVERRYHAMARRSGLFGDLEAGLRRGFYEDEEDAADRARHRKTVLDSYDKESIA
jgi:DNA sulfur modification protein DndC